MHIEFGAARRSSLRGALAIALLSVAACWPAGTASGQQVTIGNPAAAGGTGFRQTLPTDEYFAVLGVLYDGDYQAALNGFQDCLRSGLKTPSSFWIDSICYHTMCGETYFQIGQYAQALDHFNKALQLQVAFNDWMIPVKFDAVIRPANQASLRPIPWGKPNRPMMIGHFSDSVLIQQGSVDQSQVIARGGGVVQQATQRPINPQEIVRCVCLSLRRRHEILGPLAPYDTLAGQFVSVMTKRPVQPNHWTESWIDVMLGCAFAAIGKDPQAKPLLEKSLLAGGTYDHPLTSTALLELGRIALNAGDYDLATKYFEEASYSGFYFFDPLMVEDAFRYAMITHVTANRAALCAVARRHRLVAATRLPADANRADALDGRESMPDERRQIREHDARQRPRGRRPTRHAQIAHRRTAQLQPGARGVPARQRRRRRLRDQLSPGLRENRLVATVPDGVGRPDGRRSLVDDPGRVRSVSRIAARPASRPLDLRSARNVGGACASAPALFRALVRGVART
ncbi:MAG: hypothetical protein QM775_01145 [Pirellulales bacterium]